MSLSDKRRILAQGLAKGHNDQQAVKAAGYKSKGPAACNQVARMMKNGEFRKYLEKLREKTESSAIASITERKEFLTRGMRGEHEGLDRLKSVDILNKMDGVYEEKQQLPPNVIVTIGGNAE